MKTKEFVQAIEHIIEACGYVTEGFCDQVLRIYDFVTVPDEEAEDNITFELTLMSNNASYNHSKDVYLGAKRIKEIMRDCHMI